MDKLPIDLALTQQFLYSNIADQQALIERNKVAILELLFRAEKNNINIEAARKYIKIQEELTPSKPLEVQKKKVEIASQNATIERQIMENLEGQERLIRHKETIAAAELAKIELQKTLQESEEAHTKLIDDFLKSV